VELTGRVAAMVGAPGGGLLLDLDGTLVLSEETQQGAYRTYFARRGWDVPDGVVREFSGRRAYEVFPVLDGPWRGEDPVALTAAVIGVLRETAVPPLPVPGAERLLAAGAEAGVPIAVVTSAGREWVVAALGVLGATPLDVRMVTAEDCTLGKPNPEPFRRGAEALGLDPAGLVAVEDTPAGVTSARAAGVGLVIGVTTTRSAADLRAAGAHATTADLTALARAVERPAVPRLVAVRPLVEEPAPAPALPATVRLQPGVGGLPVVRVDGEQGWAEIHLHGAQVTAWGPRGHRSLLWLSAASHFRPDTAIRGGIPVCFPWFGPLAEHPGAPRHGFARTSRWSLLETHDNGRDVTVRLGLTDDDATRSSAWPHRFEAVVTIVVGSRLSVALEVTNHDDVPVTFEEALHTYLDADVARVEILGLEGTSFLDKTATPPVLGRELGPLRVTSQVDRVYLGTTADIVVRAGSACAIRVGKSGSATTVVWNPWVDGARAAADLTDDAWTTMLCVEASNVGPSAVRLEPGARHTMSTTIGLDRRHDAPEESPWRS
jgi:D-hexose-6-phosphate mutarotase/beta-phosphoglucomutase-like phosphatase (HAD superfamily)